MAGSIRRAMRPAGRVVRQAAVRLGLEGEAQLARFRSADLAVFHDFSASPAGGGNQTLRAILGEMERRGVRIERGTISRTSRAVLFNSFNFDFERLQRLARGAGDVRM